MECRRGLAMRILSVRPSVRLSVYPSVKREHCDETEERYAQIFVPYERSFRLVQSTKILDPYILPIYLQRTL